MASTNNNVSNNENNQTSGEEERVDVGTLVFNVSNDDLDKIKEKIGDILQAQLILRGDNSLGYGKVIFSGPGASNAEGGDISGDARLTRGSRRGRGAARGGRGARRNAARARRSADEQEGEESTVTAAANGVTSVVSGLVDGVKNLVVGGTEAAATGAEEGAAEKGTGNAAGRGGKGKRGRGAARAARPRKERGEPSKTLVFIRNIPFSYAEEQVRSLFAEHNLSFSSLSMPVWKFGPHKGKGRGFAFATVSDEEEQKKTIETLNGKEIHTGEMYTPRAHKAPATALAEGGGAITAQGETQPTAAGEVAQPEPTERVLKLVARQGFENEEKNTEEQHEQEGAAADAADAAAAAAANGTGPEDSGTA